MDRRGLLANLLAALLCSVSLNCAHHCDQQCQKFTLFARPLPTPLIEREEILDAAFRREQHRDERGLAQTGSDDVASRVPQTAGDEVHGVSNLFLRSMPLVPSYGVVPSSEKISASYSIVVFVSSYCSILPVTGFVY